MSVVEMAYDLIEGRQCAIKRMKPSPDEKLLMESFHREISALEELSTHPFIVTLYDAGRSEDGSYLVLEWVPGNLVDHVSRIGAMHWADFWPVVGRPTLEAIVFAQGRGWNHRDIKPANILVTEAGAPRIADYGIAKRFERPSLGFTFGQFRSVPFTPPEDDTEAWSCSRDCFSWAAVAVYCLSGTMPADYGILSELLISLDETKIPVDILKAALSHNPGERPPTASALLAEIEAFVSARESTVTASRLLHLLLTQDCARRMLGSLGASGRHEVERFVLEELEEVRWTPSAGQESG